MPARHPSEWDELYAILSSWLFQGDVTTILDTTGNTGNVLSSLINGIDKLDEREVICLRNDLKETTPPLRTQAPNDPEYGITKKGVTEYLQAVNAVEDGLTSTSSSSNVNNPILADVVCGFELSDRRQYTNEEVGELLGKFLDQTGRPDEERILTAIVGLRENGRGMLVVPRGKLISYHSIFNYFESLRLHAILDLDPEKFEFENIDSRFQLCIILFENEPLKKGSNPVRYIEVQEFNDKLGSLIHSPIIHLKNINLDGKPLEIHIVDQRDFFDFHPQVPVNLSEYLPIFRSNEFVTIGELDEIAVYRDIQTPIPDAYYFTDDGVKKSSISPKLFTPLIRRDTIIESNQRIKQSDVNHHILDLRDPISEIERRHVEPTTETVLDKLREMGHDDAINYLTKQISNKSSTTKYWFCPILNRAEKAPDFAFLELAPNAEWRRITLDTAIVDRRCIGVSCADDVTTKGLHRIIQTKEYQKLIEGLLDSSFGGVLHYRKYLIHQIPIPRKALTTEFIQQSDSVFPPKTRQDEIQFAGFLSDCISDDRTKETLEQLFNADDGYAWAWFLTPDEYDEFKQQWESDTEAAKQFVTKRLGSEELERIRRDLKRDSVPPQRSQIMVEMLEEYQQQKYRLFLYGITPQFEGTLVDWAQRQGHESGEDEDGNYVVIIDPNQDETVKKTLSELLDYYLRDGFGEFLHQHVRERRNELAHGEIVENDRNQATMFLLCLYVLYRRTLLNS